LKGGIITEDMAKDDLDSIIEELNSIHKWSCIGIMAGLVGVFGIAANAPVIATAPRYVFGGMFVVVVVAGIIIVVSCANLMSTTKMLREGTEGILKPPPPSLPANIPPV
jgi:hypothetical protein